jgi:hypothetical protein
MAQKTEPVRHASKISPDRELVREKRCQQSAFVPGILEPGSLATVKSAIGRSPERPRKQN